MPPRWQFWVDRGGTFTDIVGRTPAGQLVATKLLSVAPGRYLDATVPGIRALLAAHGTPDARIERVRVGTTVATNALLERSGAATALVITRGLGDALAIGTQERPQLFVRDIRLPTPLYSRIIEARERVTAEGAVLEPLATAELADALEAARRAGIISVAIVLLHGWRFPEHEREAARLARAAGFESVETSHEVAALEGLVPRGQTTVAEAYLAPRIKDYVANLTAELGALGAEVELEFMQSHGGLAPAAAFRGPHAVLSGPAGGLVGMVKTAAAVGLTRLVGFDMGGTSTDVSLYDGRFARRSELRIAGIRLQVPALDIHTVAAGGGSVLRYLDGRCAVGPESAGAVPGPVAYGRGGPLAVTDIHVLLGRLRPERLPRVFGHDGSAAIEVAAVRSEFAALAASMAGPGSPPPPVEEVAAGFLAVAIDTMANAIKHVCLAAGHDPSRFTLACFGGAAGQHACRVAAALGMRSIFIDRLAGVLSAVGIGLAEPRAVRRGTLARALDPAGIEAARALGARLAADAQAALGASSEAARELRAEIRVADSEVALAVEFGSVAAMAAAFRAEHARRFGYRPAEDASLIVAAVSVELIGRAATELPAVEVSSTAPRTTPVEAWFAGCWQQVPLVDRDSLAVGAVIEGPAIIAEDTATTVVEPHWRAQLVAGGGLMLTHDGAATGPQINLERPDPVFVEIFGGLYMHVAEQMGTVLRQTASSVNIRERLDYSCALFDADSHLVANAPHMPVHLGSMGASVRAVRELHGAAIRPGDAFLVNSPYAGGTHLPDLTVVSPVHLDGAARASFWVASRAHHADIGGTTPGSMPPFSRDIGEEGALFNGERIVSGGQFDAALVRAILLRGPWPARSVARNLADLAAQLAANARGAAEIGRLVTSHGAATVTAYMAHVQANAEARVRAALRALAIADQGAVRHECELDGGERLVVTLEVDGRRGAARVDFTGTSAQSTSNFNAPRAVCTAAVLYVFRTLVDGDIPLNEGCLAPLELVIPAGSLLDPQPPAAVVAGNVETSQAIVDLLYGALGVLAGSQGTMNNFTFGDADCQYYETIAGGAGAGAGFHGASGVQTHMTNSRLTDAEVLEARLPVLLREFRYRRGSGGRGLWHGGDGLVRRLEFRRALEASILANHRRIPPRGLAGGHDGACGRTTVYRVDGSTLVLGATDSVQVAAGDAIEIESPGGGGFGTPEA